MSTQPRGPSEQVDLVPGDAAEVVTAHQQPVINVLVTEFATYEMTVDPSAPEWDWLLRYPDEQWPELLRQSANETDGTLANKCDYKTVTGAWREVNLHAQ